MTAPTWLIAHQFLSVVVGVVALGLAASILSQHRPAGTTFAWLLAIFFAPYVGIPLYLAFGVRKVTGRGAPPALPGAGTVLSDHSLVGGASSVTHIEWLDDGVRAYEAFLREILRATRSIRIVTFVIGDDDTGRALLDALAKRAEEGVVVHLLLDDLLRFHAPRGQLERLVRAGGRVARFMPLVHFPFRGRSNLRNHRKIALFDGEVAIVGGMNLADEYMGPVPSPGRWVDISVLVRGEAVAVLDATFAADWLFATGDRLAHASSVSSADAIPMRVVPSGPDSYSDPIYDAILTAVFRAERRLWVATPYFVPDEPLVRALLVAARRGVHVRIIVPARSNHALADLVGASYLRELSDCGIDVRRFLPGMLHAKTLLVDESLAVVGSANFDMRSLFLDFEIALFFSGTSEVVHLAAWFEKVALTTGEGLPLAGWARSRAESIVRLVAPLV
jgi:cardiolipin synthase